MKVPCQWFLTFEGFNRECYYLFRTEVTGLHLDGNMRRKECRAHVQSKSALQSGLHVKCDIAGTYLFWYSCIPRVLSPNCRRVIILRWCHKSCSLLRCGEHNEHNSLCRDAMQHHSCPSYHQWHQPDLLHYMPRPLLHTYCADPERRCTLCCQMMRGRAGTVNSVIWMWSRLILTNMHLGSLRSQM